MICGYCKLALWQMKMLSVIHTFHFKAIAHNHIL